MRLPGQLLTNFAALRVYAGEGLIWKGFVGLGFPLFTDIHLCECEIDLDPSQDHLIELSVIVDVGVVKLGPPKFNIGDRKKLNGSIFDQIIDTVEGTWYGVASDFRKHIYIDDQEIKESPGWFYEVNAKQVFKMTVDLPRELHYDPRYCKKEKK